MIDDIRDAGILASIAYTASSYSTQNHASENIERTSLAENWAWVDPTLLGVDAQYVDHGFFSYTSGIVDDQALLAYNADSRTLAISFRGTSGGRDLATDVMSDYGSAYADFETKLIQVVLANAASLGATRILVTGHSLGAAMAEEMMGHHLEDDRLVAVTFGSPGATSIDNRPEADSRIINIGHVDLTSNLPSPYQGDAVFRIKSASHIQGSDIRVDLPGQADYTLAETAALALADAGDYGQHEPYRYQATAAAIAAELAKNLTDHHPFDVRAYSYVIGSGFLYGTHGANVIIGSSEADSIVGLAGNDILDGAGGDDHIIGSDGDDIIYGEGENDIIRGDAGNDIIDGGDGTDTAVYNGLTADHFIMERHGNTVTVRGKFQPDFNLHGSDTLTNIEQLEFFDPTTGTRTIQVSSLLDLSAGTQPGGTASDGHVTGIGGGASGNDGLASGINTTTVTGNDTSEYLIGTSGPDVIHGNGGDDVLTGYAGQDTFDGGFGSDTVDYSYQPASVSGTVDLAADIATFPGYYTEQLNSIENVWMGAGNDYVYGDTGANDLRGGPGDDLLRGGTGNDVIYGDWKYSDQGGNDTAILGYTLGTGYTVSGSAKGLHIVGAEGDDWYYNVENFQFAGGETTTATALLQDFLATPTKIGGEIVVNTSSESSQQSSSLTTLANGHFVVVWTDNSGNIPPYTLGTEVRGQTFDAGGAKVGSEFLINTSTDGSQFSPTVATLSDEAYIVTWLDGSQINQGYYVLRGQLFNYAGGKIGQEFSISTMTQGGLAEIAALSDEKFVIVWGSHGQLFNADGSKLGSEFFLDSTSTGGVASPQVVALLGGGFFVTWGNGEIYGRLFDANGTAVGSEFIVNETIGGIQWEPTAIKLADGRLVVAWMDTQNPGYAYSLQGQLLDADGSPSGHQFTISSTSTNSPDFYAKIAPLPDGRFVALYEGANGFVEQAVQIFSADGAPSGHPVTVSLAAEFGNVNEADIAVSRSGNFIVSWTDGGFYSSDVHAQAFSSYQDSFFVSGTLSTQRVSVASNGAQAIGNNANDGVSISGNGRYVVFSSSASNLVPHDTNGNLNIYAGQDIFVRDQVTNTTERVSVASDGTEADAGSFGASISADGRYVTFLSRATNLIADDNISTGLFVHDRVTHATTLVPVEFGTPISATISEDGRYLAYLSGNYNPGTFSPNNIYIYDLVTRATDTLVTGGISLMVDLPLGKPTISADGNYVVFTSRLPLLQDDTGVNTYIIERSTHALERVTGPSLNGFYVSPSISADGRYVAFISSAADIVPGDVNGANDVFVYDRLTHTTERIPTTSDHPDAIGDPVTVAISADGRYVTYNGYQLSNHLGLSEESDFFVYDRLTRATELLTAGSGPKGNPLAVGPGLEPHVAISEDGRFVAFGSWSSSLVPGDTNASLDYFVVDLQSNANPVAQSDALTIDASSVLSGNVLADNGLGIDRDTGGGAISIFAVNGLPPSAGHTVTLASGALLIVNPDGRFVYDPNGKFNSLAVGQNVTDGFTYTIVNGQGNVATATVTLTIAGTMQGLQISNGSGTLNGTSVDDQIGGGAGNDTIYGGAGYDWLQGGAGTDTLFGDAGNDSLEGGPGNDVLNGGSDTNTAVYSGVRSDYQISRFSAGSIRITDTRNNSSDGSDTASNIQFLQFADDIYSVEQLLPSSQLTTTGTVDYSDGNTQLAPDITSILFNAAGNATVTFSASQFGPGLISSSIAITGDAFDNLVQVKLGVASTFSASDWTFTNWTANDRVILAGSAGADVLAGTAFNDTLDGGAGTDTADYSSATQAIVVDLPGHIALGAQVGTDTLSSIENVRTGSGDDAVAGNGATNVLDGGAGIDTVSYYAVSSGVVLDLAGQTGVDGTSTDTLLNFENANGTAYNDAISGTAAANVLNGLGGIDTISYYLSTQGVLIDLAGNVAIQGGITDTILNFENAYGSAFNDAISGNAGANVLDGLGGIDTLSYYTSSRGLVIDLAFTVVVENGVTDIVRNFENVNATSQNDSVSGNAAANILNGLGGIDTISYYALGQGVTIDLSAGTGVSGGVTDTLLNFENANGSQYADNITGNGGANVLNGLGGTDTLTGGGGSDTFVFRAGQADGDVITDFTGNGAAAGDTISLVGFGSAAQGATFTQLNTTQWQIHSGLDGHSEIVTLSNAAAVHGSDFFLV
ncbi:MAG: hypothetical protein ABIL01_35910 [Pseudomonadota bacterium]